MMPLIISRQSFGVKKIGDRRPAQCNRPAQNLLERSVKFPQLHLVQPGPQLRRMDLRLPQAFVRVDVADAPQHMLVQQERLDSCPAPMNRLGELLEPRLQRIHPEAPRSEEHTSELQSRRDLVCRLLLEKKKKK